MSIEKNVSVLPITEKDLEWWQNKIVKLDWVFAVTYAEGTPHEYIAERTEGITKADFIRAARVIHTFGELANSSFGERQSTHRIARFRRPESMEPPGRRSVAALYSQ